MASRDLVRNYSSAPYRVLVIENDPNQRADQVQCLRGWGYEVFVAEAPLGEEDAYQSLRADALEKARDFDCHIVVIDQRLKSDVSRDDNSGLELAEELAQELPLLHAIILSGYAVPASLASGAVFGRYVGKQEGAEALKRAIEATIEQIRAICQTSGA